jgi:fumarate hydratase class I
MMIKLHAPDFVHTCTELIRQAACDLPEDILSSIRSAQRDEAPGSIAFDTIGSILDNIERARTQQRPVCQDTGMPCFSVDMPYGASMQTIREQINEAVVLATRDGYLRPNAVDPVTGKNSGNNLGIDIPVIHFREWKKNTMRVACMLKGGGSENVSAQYSLPEPALQAGRDLEGVSACVLDAVWKAQGKGCSPGIIGVGIGGDRITGMQKAKDQLFRLMKDENPDPVLSDLERTLYEKINRMGIGPMGLGGNTTVLGVKIGSAHRHPACYFVSIAYMCWACRRSVMEFEAEI